MRRTITKRKSTRNKKSGWRKQDFTNRKWSRNMALVSGNRMSAFPDTYRTAMVYAENIASGIQATTYYEYTFSGNSLGDPDFTSAGHQPKGHDQLSAIYSRYRVFASSIEVTAVNATANSAAYFILWPSAEAAAVTVLSDVLEETRTAISNILSIAERYGRKMKHYATTSQVYGIPPSAVQIDDTYAATTGASPTRRWFWRLFFDSCDQASLIDVSFAVKIVYYGEYYDRIRTAQS